MRHRVVLLWLLVNASCCAIVVAFSFLDYFVSYAEKLSTEQYPVVNGEILRYVRLLNTTSLHMILELTDKLLT